MLLSVGLHLYKTSRPHVAEVDIVPGSYHFRNVTRHNVVTDPQLLTLRVDDSLHFANACVMGIACSNGMRPAADTCCKTKRRRLCCSIIAKSLRPRFGQVQ